jgi:hypothetical protein
MQNLTITIMRNSFKLGLLALTVSVTVLACDPPKTTSEKTPADSASKTIDTAKKAAIDSAKKDSVKK